MKRQKAIARGTKDAVQADESRLDGATSPRARRPVVSHAHQHTGSTQPATHQPASSTISSSTGKMRPLIPMAVFWRQPGLKVSYQSHEMHRSYIATEITRYRLLLVIWAYLLGYEMKHTPTLFSSKQCMPCSWVCRHQN